VFSRIGLWQFSTAHATSMQPGAAPEKTPAESRIDFSLWSSKRIEAFRDGLALKMAPPIAILRIPHLELNAPLFEGTDDLT
jgi:hypothetical protein